MNQVSSEPMVLMFNFTYGWDSRLVLGAWELETIAQSLQNQMHGPEWLGVAQVNASMKEEAQVRELFEKHLAGMGFRLCEGFDADKKLVSLSLVYERRKT